MGARSPLSILLVSWNSADDLLRLLRGLSFPELEYEILVVDNASSDGTPERVAAEFPGIRLICNARNLGFAGGVNVGIRASRHPLVLLLNPDTRVSGEAVVRLVDQLDAHPEVGIVGPRVLNEDGSRHLSLQAPSRLAALESRTLRGQRHLRTRAERRRLGLLLPGPARAAQPGGPAGRALLHVR